MPQPITASTPYRRISEPVKNEGRYMPSTCHWITSVESATVCPHISMAMGVAVITVVITAKPTVDPASAVRYTGWRTICHSGREGPCARSTFIGGTDRRAMKNSARMPSAISARYVARKGGAARSSVKRTMAGPAMAATIPPDTTQEIARLRYASLATSEAANR